MEKISVEWQPGAKDKILNQFPDKVMFTVARMTLDGAFIMIPKGKTGDLRKTSMSAGVRSSENGYYVGSFTNYAKAVWNMPDSTRWSTPGTTGKWYKKYWDNNKNSLIENAIERNKLK